MIGGRRSVISRWWEIGTSRCQTQKTPAPAAMPCSTDPTDNSRSSRRRRNTRDLAGLVRRGGSGREAMQNAFARPIVEHLITRRKHCIVVIQCRRPDKNKRRRVNRWPKQCACSRIPNIYRWSAGGRRTDSSYRLRFDWGLIKFAVDSCCIRIYWQRTKGVAIKLISSQSPTGLVIGLPLQAQFAYGQACVHISICLARVQGVPFAYFIYKVLFSCLLN